MFSYGSGCCSEFYSGTVTKKSREILRSMNIDQRLEDRYELSMAEYDGILDLNLGWLFGIRDKKVDNTPYQHIYDRVIKGRGAADICRRRELRTEI